MSITTAIPTVTEPGLGSGVVEVNLFDDDGNPTGWIDTGYTIDFPLTIDTGTPTESFSRRNSSRAKIFSKAGTVSRTFTATTQSINDEMLKIWLAATVSTVTQTASGVTNEEWVNVQYGRLYRFGESTTNPGGVRGVSSVTLRTYPSAATSWSSSAYALGDYVDPGNGYVYRVTTDNGNSDASEPTWPTTIGQTVTDGDLVWTCVDTKKTFVANTDYELDDSAATGGRVLWTESAGDHSYVFADYTPTANSRTRLSTGTSAQKSGKVRFYMDEPNAGEIFTCQSCTIRPSGDYALLGDETTLQSLTFEIEILEPASGAAIVRDGAPS